MGITQKDLKLLWGRSGNRCAICKKELSFDAEHSTEAFPLGEEAHIVAEEENGPRGKSILTAEQRSAYHNRILFCPNHHTEIDKNARDWPVERLHMVKTEHEIWVQSTLSKTTDVRSVAEQAVVANIVDSAVEKCRLREWQGWTSYALAPNPQWPGELPEQIFAFREQVIAAVWPPNCEELKRATITFSILLNSAAQIFLKHAKEQGGRLYTDTFYQNEGRYNPHYDQDVKLYEKWLRRCHAGIEQATQAANWFADVVRRDLNPMFFALEGKFLLTEGPFENLSFRTVLLEFTENEKALTLEALLALLDSANSGTASKQQDSK